MGVVDRGVAGMYVYLGAPKNSLAAPLSVRKSSLFTFSPVFCEKVNKYGLFSRRWYWLEGGGGGGAEGFYGEG